MKSTASRLSIPRSVKEAAGVSLSILASFTFSKNLRERAIIRSSTSELMGDEELLKALASESRAGAKKRERDGLLAAISLLKVDLIINYF